MDAWSLNPERHHLVARKLDDVPLAHKFPDTSAEDHPVLKTFERPESAYAAACTKHPNKSILYI
jgi:hypothetical protein